ncbi:hypothetical protein OUZ56_029496 [Daphnia magna]|uniref:Uncharacterized protein n=1 Tax=Daphnia magna TaxID=35525 RepID=A0ABR0B6Z4_9CRUS|nr:hypothetical protein OUZ56_029496 [Daphnia magna]
MNGVCQARIHWSHHSALDVSKLLRSSCRIDRPTVQEVGTNRLSTLFASLLPLTSYSERKEDIKTKQALRRKKGKKKIVDETPKKERISTKVKRRLERDTPRSERPPSPPPSLVNGLDPLTPSVFTHVSAATATECPVNTDVYIPPLGIYDVGANGSQRQLISPNVLYIAV